MIHTIVRGIELGFGLIVGLAFGLWLILRLFKKASKQKFDIAELIKAFSKFESQLQEHQQYELIPKLRAIVEEIEKSGVYSPSKEAFFIVKPDLEFIIKEGDEGESALRIVKKYNVVLKSEA